MQSDRSVNEQMHFDDLASQYEGFYHLNSPVALRKVERLSAEYADYLNSAPTGSLVEIGSGTGFYTRHLVPKIQGHSYSACDISEEMIEVSKRTFPENHEMDIQWKVEDCLHTEFEDSSVSGVTGHAILHHLPLEESIKEISRVLVTGGRIAFYEPNMINPYVFLVKKVPFLRPKGDTPDETAINPFVLKRLLLKYGFDQIQITPYELALNNIPEFLIPLFEAVSRVVVCIPVVRYLGGSLKIKAVRK